jgi:hypothetical protein
VAVETALEHFAAAGKGLLLLHIRITSPE